MKDAAVSDTLERLRLMLADRYAMERELGRGGMATVYLAQDLRHERPVAIKVLRPELSASLGADRFNREIKVAAQLQHPHILGLYDSGAADGLLYYVMPFVEGESLRDKLDREKQLGVEEAIRLVCEAADALQYAHGRNVIHRDIKPENIMLSGGHVLVADFGIAKALSEAGGAKLTETGMAVGTPYYMSPEQAMGSDIDARADQYSLGCVLYELLAGQPPFTGPTPMAILARHSLEQVPRLTIVRTSIPDAVEGIVLQALEKVPADRFPTMKAFADALREADIGRLATRTGARPVPTQAVRARVQRQPGWRRVLPWGAAAIALVVVALAGAAAWRKWGPAHGTTDASAAGADPNRLAVLYFQRRGGPDSLQYLADGLTEALIHELSQVKGLQVVSRNGVAPYKTGNVAPDSIGRALKAGTLVSGTVAQSGDRLRVTVALVSPATGTEFGTTTLERPRQELFALQDDIAREVSVFLRKELGHEVEVQQLRANAKNPQAWEAFQRAQASAKEADTLMTTGDTAAAGRQYAAADSQLAQTERLDHDWPAPAVLRGWIQYRRSRLARSAPASYHMERIRDGLAHAEEALKPRPNDPDALELRGTLQYWEWLNNWAPDPSQAAKLLNSAEQDLRAAVTANSAQASAWATLSHLIPNKAGGSLAEAKLAALRAYDADPYLETANVTVWRLFGFSYDLDDAVEAKHWCDEGQRRFLNDARFLECQIWYLGMRGAKPDASAVWQLYDQYVKLTPVSLRPFNELKTRMFVALALARAGLADSARSLGVHSRGDATVDPTRELAYYEAVLRVALGDKDEAFRLLSTYLASNPKERDSFASDEETWELKPLHDDARWKTLVGR